MERKCCWNCSHCFYLKDEKHDCCDVSLYLCENKNQILDEFYVQARGCKMFSYSDDYSPRSYY